MPSPYRRSCRDCAKAKRRCDLNSPCYRCRVRSLQCTYEKDTRSARNVALAEVAGVEDSASTVSPQNETIINAAQMSDVNMVAGPLDAYNNNVTADLTMTGSALPSFPDYDLDWPD